MGNLVGHSLKDVPPDKLMFYDMMLYRIKMGYTNPFEPKAHDSIEYHPSEHVYDHDLSIVSVGRHYSANKLQDIIPLELYLKLPTEVVAGLIEGLSIGIEDRINYDLRKAQEETDAANLEKSQRAAADSFNQISKKT